MKRTIIILSALLFSLALAYVLLRSESDSPKQDAVGETSGSAGGIVRAPDSSGEEPVLDEGTGSGSSTTESFRSAAVSRPGTQPESIDEEKPEGESAAVVEVTQETKDLLDRNALEAESMVLAHSSLLLPAVADPDSKENKEILRQMMFKALATPMEQTGNSSK